MDALNPTPRVPWNKGKLVGQKAPPKAKDVWAIRAHLQMKKRPRELALFNLGFDSKLRGCDLVTLRVRDVCHGDKVANRATVMQHKTHRPVQFEITPCSRTAVEDWIRQAHLRSEDFLFPSRIHASGHIAQGFDDLQEDEEPQGGADPAGALQGGEHCSVLGHRSGRRARPS